MGRKVWTAAELERLSHADRQAIFEQSIVRDLSDVPAELLEELRAAAQQHIETHEAKPAE